MHEVQATRFEDKAFDVRSAPALTAQKQNFQENEAVDNHITDQEYDFQVYENDDDDEEVEQIKAQINRRLSSSDGGIASISNVDKRAGEVLTTNEAVERFQQENERLLNEYVARLESGRISQ